MSGCSTCANYTCETCTNKTAKFKPTMTVKRACSLIHMLLGTQDCDTICPDWELCQLLRFQCELNCGRIQLAPLAMLVAASMLQSEAANYARAGRFKTLTIEVQSDRTANILLSIADRWRAEAMACTGTPKFRIARTGKGCQPPRKAFQNVGCHQYIQQGCDSQLMNCNFDCCEDCDDIIVTPATDTTPETITIPAGRLNVPI